ncbi:MAG: hypothetical protein IKI08_00925 [Selenomonadaceae bacterium]|nr:hypothetical protein [Selenomonadaceae bacterium]
MRKELHKDFNKVIFDKLNEWKNSVGEEFSVNLIDAFWLMHLDFEHFIKHLRPTPTDKKRNALAFREDIDSIKHKILEHYSRRFEDDFQNYPTNMFDKIDYEFRNLDLEKSVPISNELLSKTLELVKDVKSLFKEIKNFQNRYSQELQLQKPISSLADIEKLQTSLLKDELSPEVRKHLSLISTKATGLKAQVRELMLNHDEIEFNAAIKFCDEHASKLGELGKPLKNYLTAIYYLLDHSFNVELILLFLFGRFDRTGAGEALKLVIERHEKFFLSLYNELKSFYPQIDVLLEIATNDYPRAVEEEHYQWLPKFSPPDEPRAILFKLKKLIHLYNFYCKAQKLSLSKCVEHVLFTYEKILIETRFTEFHYAPMWSNLPNYMMNFFGLNQSDLAKILGVGNYNITREMSKGTLVTNHKVLFQAATDFSYTYILGETTIPHYGKNYSHETKYMLEVAVQMAYAEMFLNYIDALVEYREEIANTPHISKSKISSKNEYTLKMTEQIQIMVRRIQEMRVFLNELDEQRTTCKNDISSKLLEVTEQLRDNLLRALEICANIFKQSVFDCRTVPTYEDIQTAEDKFVGMKSKRNEAYDLDKADEIIGNLQRKYESLKKELEIRPKLQQELLDKLEQCLCEL